MMDTALQAATDALETASWLVLLWILQERASWLQVSCICCEVQAGIFFKGTCKKNLVEGLRIAYCPKVTNATAQLCLFILPHQCIDIFDVWS